MILIAVIFLLVQKPETTYPSHYFLSMSLNRCQRRCPQCTFWFSSLSRHYQYSQRCNLTSPPPPHFSSNGDGEDMVPAEFPDDLSFEQQVGYSSPPLHPKVMKLPLLLVCLRMLSMIGFFPTAIIHPPQLTSHPPAFNILAYCYNQ